MARKRKRVQGENPEIPMTPMIDVVFQLLIYFIVTMKPVDVIAHLDVSRPQADTTAREDTTPPRLLRIVIFPDGYSINDRPVSLEDLGGILQRLAGHDQNQTVLITAGSLSPHKGLVSVLDLCSNAGLKNLSVISAE